MTKLPLSVLALTIASSIQAQTDQTANLDSMVITASGLEQKLTHAPASITLITKEELDQKPYMTLLDAVRNVEGVDVGETTDKTGQGGISIRGMGADYTLILVDGKRQNNIGDIYPNNFGGNQFNHIPPRELIERIEVIRGPASTLYGADALGGVINIITKRTSEKWQGSLSHSRTIESNDDYGNDSTTEFSLSGPVIADTLGVGVRGSFYQRDASKPQYAPDLDPNGNAIPRDLGYGSGGRTVDNENYNLGLRLDYTLSANQDLTFDYDVSKQEYDNTPTDGANPLGTTDAVDRLPRAGYALDQAFTREQYSIRHEGRWSWANSDVTLHKVNTSNDGRTLPLTALERLEYENLKAASASDDVIASTFLPRPERVLETRQTTLNVKLDSMIGRHALVYGGQYIDAEMEDGTFGMTGSGFDGGEAQPHEQWSVFIEDNVQLTSSFTLTAGIRHDDHNIFGGHASPRLYGNWELSSEWVIKGGVSSGYKAPLASDLYPGITGFGGQGTKPFIGTTDLKPETSVNSEMAVYYNHKDGHNVNVTVFSNQFKDKIESGGTLLHCDDPAATGKCADLASEWNEILGDGYTFGQQVNIDKAEINGVEVAGRYWLLQNVSLQANYTYTDAKIKSGENKGDPLTGTAKHMANSTINWQVTPSFETYLTTEFRSKRYTSVPRGWSAELDYPEYFKDYTVFHLGARYAVTPNLSLTARINNLLDEDFTEYSTVFTTEDNGATYEPNYVDSYNVKAKARNLWVSLALSF